MEVHVTSATTGEWIASATLPKTASASDLHDALQSSRPTLNGEPCCYHAIVDGALLAESVRLAAVGIRNGSTLEALRCRKTAVLTVAEDGGLKVYNAETGLCVVECPTNSGKKSQGGSFSSDGHRHLSYSADRATVYLRNCNKTEDHPNGPPSLALRGHRGLVHSAVFSNQGFHIATASADGIAALWNARTGQCLRRFEGHSNEVHTVAFCPSAPPEELGEATPAPPVRIITSSSDQTAKIWLTATGACLRSFDHPCAVSSAELSPDGRYAVTAAEDRRARLWSVRTGGLLRTFEHMDLPVVKALFCRGFCSPILDAETASDVEQKKGVPAAVQEVENKVAGATDKAAAAAASAAAAA